MKTYIYKYVQSVVPITCEGYITLLKFLSIGDSSNGRTADSDSVSIGSNPISPANNVYINLAPSSSGPGHDPLKVEIAGSNPAGVTK